MPSAVPCRPAAGLEAELVRVAVELETSRLAKLAGAAASPARRRSPEDMEVRLQGRGRAGYVLVCWERCQAVWRAHQRRGLFRVAGL